MIEINSEEPMSMMRNNTESTYKVVRILEDGQEVFVAGHKNLTEAERLVASLAECWPGEYLIQGPHLSNRVVVSYKCEAPQDNHSIQ
jgi:hypothetical protein